MISDFLIFSPLLILEPEGLSQQSLCDSGGVKGEAASNGKSQAFVDSHSSYSPQDHYTFHCGPLPGSTWATL